MTTPSATADPSGKNTYQTSEVEHLLELRAERLRPKPSATEDEIPFWVAEFPVGDEQFAIPLNSLRACVPLRMVTPVPLSASHVIGILRFQGEIISAFSLSALLEGRGWRADPSVLLIVNQDELGGQLVALDCEAIPRQSALPVQAVELAQANQQGAVADITIPGSHKLIHLIDLPLLLQRTTEVRHGG